MQSTTPSPTDLLLAGANPGGGWGYAAGKASRVEPTCWALLAAGQDPRLTATLPLHRDFLTRCQQPSGWLVEDSHWPVNIGFNALAAFTWFEQPALIGPDPRRRLLAALLGSKGTQAPQFATVDQNNSLQGWSWTDGTFSWVEPTCWGLLALKRARRAGTMDAASDVRIADAEALLIDRTCRDGGWNFGNANMMQQDLRAYVPTTALGLLAMQDRREHPAVVRSLAFLEAHWSEEISATALGLSIVCLSRYGRSVDQLEKRLREQLARANAFGSLTGLAIAAIALNARGRSTALSV